MDATLKTVIGGELVELPGTIAGVRAALPPPERRDEFDREIAHAPATELPLVLVRWALAGTGAEEEDEALFERLVRGEDIGAHKPSDAGTPGPEEA
ncbi:hypothetical protein AB0I22_35705 [Streptomyces sp. NPDC050610]|uniref:hypothetical protein n=1 Tax=Streptomyces sp. NPDC050610 TaxID=3157097 RepID=UPI00343A1141